MPCPAVDLALGILGGALRPGTAGQYALIGASYPPSIRRVPGEPAVPCAAAPALLGEGSSAQSDGLATVPGAAFTVRPPVSVAGGDSRERGLL